ALGRGDEQERRLARAEQLADALRSLADARRHVAEALEELRQVAQQVDARHPLEHREEDPAAAPEDLEPDPPRPQEELERARVDEARQPLRRLEEVERVAARRR